ncbi:MAG: 4Fe-4S binding protein [Deltaproteobacteria bacterium]
MFGPLITKAGASKSNKTGAWRTEVKPKFKREACIGCKICMQYCPEGCVTGTKKEDIDVDMSFCKGCGICAAVCPKKAVEMVKES